MGLRGRPGVGVSDRAECRALRIGAISDMWLSSTSVTLRPFTSRVSIPPKTCKLQPFSDTVIDITGVISVLNSLDDHDVPMVCLIACCSDSSVRAYIDYTFSRVLNHRIRSPFNRRPLDLQEPQTRSYIRF